MRKTTVILFGSAADPEVKERSRKIKTAGRKVEYRTSSHPDGTGPCGNICSCKEFCKVAYEGDNGATMCKSF